MGRIRSSEPPQPSLTNSEKFKKGYDGIDWSKGASETPTEVIKTSSGTTIKYGNAPDMTPVPGIPAIRSDKPHVSDAAKVHVDQVGRMNELCVSGTSYNKSGQLVSTSSHAREKEARRRGKSFD